MVYVSWGLVTLYLIVDVGGVKESVLQHIALS